MIYIVNIDIMITGYATFNSNKISFLYVVIFYNQPPTSLSYITSHTNITTIFLADEFQNLDKKVNL